MRCRRPKPHLVRVTTTKAKRRRSRAFLAGACSLAVVGGAVQLPGECPSNAAATETEPEPIVAIEGRIHEEPVVIDSEVHVEP